MNIRDRRHTLELPTALLLAPLAGVQAAEPPPPDIIRELKPLSVRGVNYFPRCTPADGLWTRTPPEVWERDMALAASLGCNPVRTFLQFDAPTKQAGLPLPHLVGPETVDDLLQQNNDWARSHPIFQGLPTGLSSTGRFSGTSFSPGRPYHPRWSPA